MPVNMPAHAHGQGYSDLNFLIPELVALIEYRKGPYYAEEGDFSAAGAADVRYRRALSAPFAIVATDRDGFLCAVVAGSTRVADGDLLLAAEYSSKDRPWRVKEGYRKLDTVRKYTHGDAARLRHFGPSPLIEDNSARSNSTLIVNLEAGYHYSKSIRGVLTAFNVLDCRDNDITYFYASQLPGEPAPIRDIHFHPVEPRTVRSAVTVAY